MQTLGKHEKHLQATIEADFGIVVLVLAGKERKRSRS